MRIAYLSVALGQEDFLSLSPAPNPAGQNFHLNLIHGLAETEEVTAYAYAPQAKRKPISKNLAFVYLVRQGNVFNEAKLIASIVNNKNYDLVIYDSLVLPFALAAKHFESPSIAILTDNPANISHIKWSYNYLIKKANKQADGYFALTKGLNALFNKKRRPFLIEKGCVDVGDPKPIKRPPYLYFAGALFERYGVKDLVEAYHRFEPNLDLVIAGHGDMDEELKRDSKIHYLGQVSKEENYSYILGADAVINPRPVDPKLDPYCVPSKLLEYFCLADHVVSTPCPELSEEEMGNATILKPSLGDPTGLYSFFKNHLDAKKNLINLHKNYAKADFMIRYSPKSVAEKLRTLMLQLVH